MELQDLMKIWDRFDRSGVELVELDIDDMHFRLKKSVPQASAAVSVQQSAATASEAAQAAPENPVAELSVKGVRSPLAGTFYRSASPEEDPFVSVGSQVHKGDVIGIVEAMKLFNEVQSTEDGVVREILAEDGGLVEYNQVLIVLD